jgi:hypothetical protein
MVKCRVIVALPLLATCTMEAQKSALPVAPETPAPSIPKSHRALGTIPPGEVATWRRVGSSGSPEGRFLQAITVDTTRNVVVVFGGASLDINSKVALPSNDTWDYSPQSGKWAKRTGTGTPPDARAGAAMVYDSKRKKVVLFGGRSGAGIDYDDTWEWDPGTGAWTPIAIAGSNPSARCQLGMVYRESTGTILLFGGGNANGHTDGTTVSKSLGDTWELDPAAKTWTLLSPATSPSVRHDFGMVWDSSREKVVLFGGMQIDIVGATGVPKQDVWDWDPGTATWNERIASGTKPSPRAGHAMAFDASRNLVVVFGGLDMATAGMKNDLWDWDPTAAAWARRLSGSETGVPASRSHAAMVSDPTRERLQIFGGEINASSGVLASVRSDEVWELDPATAAFTDRTAPRDLPPERADHAMAYNPATGKVYIYGGWQSDEKAGTGTGFEDLWEWDGTSWTEVTGTPRPASRSVAAMAYDPARRSLILYGGYLYGGGMTDETWEWNGTTRAWTKLATTGSPGQLAGAGMVTDTARSRIYLFGGHVPSPQPFAVEPAVDRVWEWDGATLTWSERTAYTGSSMAPAQSRPVTGYDERRQKLLLYAGYTEQSAAGFWEWDPVTRGWAARDPGAIVSNDWSGTVYGVFDPNRRREIFLLGNSSSVGMMGLLEHDPANTTWYKPSAETRPPQRYESAMAYDGRRGVVVLFGGFYAGPGGTIQLNDTWEYSVLGLGNGEGCSDATASSCASGHCVEGVCCEAAACSGPCKSCSVAGSEGSCVLARAGTEVPGSCTNGQACDATGSCKSKNGQACSSADVCASGFCVDGTCCDSACAGTCMACNVAGREGQCTPRPVGTDPDKECGSGIDVCGAACNGAGACAFPWGVSCGTCAVCDGTGTCYAQDPCGSMGGRPGNGGVPGKEGKGGATGKPEGMGGSGGLASAKGGAGGSTAGKGGEGGSTSKYGGAGGAVAGLGGLGGGGGGGGSGGSTFGQGGAGGAASGLGGVSASSGSGGSGAVTAAPDGGPDSRPGGGGATAGSGGAGGASSSSAPGAAGGATGVTGAGGASTSLVDGGRNAGLHQGGCSCQIGGRTSTGTNLPAALAGLLLLGFVWCRRAAASRSR